VLQPQVQIVVKVTLNARQASKGGKKRFMGGRLIKEVLEIVGRIDGDSAILEFGEVMAPMEMNRSVT
jgi:hypothetical protein